ncbi:outer membrane beta-barrel protein [Pigmentibacter sp. JX0631]|uniref:outer membrane beta-barrel protein n=1 Tax=Pigmentibacter sp. JX0631 TaxID=2976982 RepID=UPI0024682E7F|nr:outer membrane beta-barrel protein [Pigmentibacter sp. JX0631]WGL59561.1 outer membrane beta-barrel protein [Pigmentibacter sp. JX0631]
MKRNALISLAGSLVVANFAFAQENSKIGLDVLAGAGYSHYNGFKSGDKSDDIKFNGFNVNATALYSIMKTEMGSPVVGLGLNYNQMKSSTTSDDVLDFSGNDLNVSNYFNAKTLAIMTNLGYKFTPTSKLAIFALANLGYGFYNKLDANVTIKDVNGKNVTDNYPKTEFELKDHFIYGVSVVGTYEIVDNFSLGLGATYNRHQAKIETKRNGATASNNGSFNEFSTNLIASYSF